MTVNILTNHAINKGVITVFGGEQKRPNLHVQDMTDCYLDLLQQPDANVRGKVWNVGAENYRVREIAGFVRDIVGTSPVTGKAISVETTSTNDPRSYHVSSEKIRRELGFVPRKSVADAVQSLTDAFSAGLVPDPMDDARYYNIRLMQQTKLQ